MKMKTKITIVLAASMLFAGVVGAAGLHGKFEGSPIVKVTSGGSELQVQDVPAINYKGRTMVPIYMLRDLGAEVKWDGATETVDVTLGAGGQEGEFTEEEIAVSWLQFYSGIANRYRDVYNYGEWLADHYEDQVQAMLSVRANYQVDAHLRDARASLKEAQDLYDTVAENASLDADWATENDFHTDLNEIVAQYANALDLFDSALTSLELYKQYKQDKDVKAYEASIEEAIALVDEWRNTAFYGYEEFYSYVSNYE
ncbi:MAG TPA: stalk domain-containing protein [Paenibacillus sp.]|nr:stalk domain-containing protein [Paenibacillus sp.]